MKIKKKDFDRAKQFVLLTMQEAEEKYGKTKEALNYTVKEMNEEFFASEGELDYQRSLMILAHEMGQTINEFKKD